VKYGCPQRLSRGPSDTQPELFRGILFRAHGISCSSTSSWERDVQDSTREKQCLRQLRRGTYCVVYSLQIKPVYFFVHLSEETNPVPASTSSISKSDGSLSSRSLSHQTHSCQMPLVNLPLQAVWYSLLSLVTLR
jgi:hypothetical protein